MSHMKNYLAELAKTVKPVTSADDNLTAGDLIAYLSQFPADMIVAAAAPNGPVSITGASNPYEGGDVVVVLDLADNLVW